jgi:predicted ATP-dependent endonuclease of OLD family
MYLKRLRLKNYRLFQDVDISFKEGMNVLIGKNSTGKSTILEAIDFLLSSNNANIPAAEIIPYDSRNQQNVSSRIDGFFEIGDTEKKFICSTLGNSNDKDSINNSHMELIYTKYINKSGKSINVVPTIQTNGNGISKNGSLLNKTTDYLVPKLQTNNVLKITDFEGDNNVQPLLPINQLKQVLQNQPFFLDQYLRSMLYDIKYEDIEDFNRIKEEILKAYTEISDIDVEFDSKRAQIQVYFKKATSDIKIPLKNEGRGIREFFYLLLTLKNFTDSVILKDEALTHLHKSLLSDFILAISDFKYQMITTSHIKELINALNFGNIIVCRKLDNKATVTNLMQNDDIDKVLEDLGYPIEPVPEVKSLISSEA